MKLKDNYMHEVYKMLAYTESSQEIKERRDLLKTGQFAKKILIFDGNEAEILIGFICSCTARRDQADTKREWITWAMREFDQERFENTTYDSLVACLSMCKEITGPSSISARRQGYTGLVFREKTRPMTFFTEQGWSDFHHLINMLQHCLFDNLRDLHALESYREQKNMLRDHPIDAFHYFENPTDAVKQFESVVREQVS